MGKGFAAATCQMAGLPSIKSRVPPISSPQSTDTNLFNPLFNAICLNF